MTDFQKINTELEHKLMIYKQMFPYNYKRLNSQDKIPENTDDMLDFFIQVFTLEKRATDPGLHEYQVRSFATSLMKSLRQYHNQLINNPKYKELCGKGHIAYGYFHSLNELIDVLSSEEWNSLDTQYKEILYWALVDFFQINSGDFYDNEEAIQLLCKFYPAKTDASLNEDDINRLSYILYSHISRCGTPNDFGYAFQGIRTIEKYINKLPPKIVLALIGLYNLYPLVYNKVFRHQLLTIIKYARFSEALKKQLKFWCLDSLQIVYAVNMFLSQKLTEDNKDAEFHEDYDDLTLSDKEIKVFNKWNLYWNNDLLINQTSDLTQARTLFDSQKPIIRIELQDNIVAAYNRKGEIAITFEYNMDDWLLENYKENQKRQQLRHLVFETEPLQKAGIMLLSLVYLDNYRGLHHQIIDFDHRYVYHRENNTFEKNADSTNKIPHFYGKSVYSLSCIVGKNATGKTSIVDFLRESFLKFLKLIKEQIIPCNNGYVNEIDYIKYGLLDPDAKFTIIFSLGEQSYYLTNIDEKNDGAEMGGIEPFSKNTLGYASELIKIAYFSNQLRNDQKELLLDEQEEKSDDEEIQKCRDILNANKDFRIADYSEKRSFIQKRRALDAEKRRGTGEEAILDRKGINKDICYQLYYLKDKLCKESDNYIDLKADNTLKLVSILGNKNISVISLDAIKREEDFLKYLKEFSLLPDAVIEHFSTGQYAKFSFLAKLHWFLKGSKEAIQQCNNLAGDYVFSNEEVLQEGKTAILFIDEGETYYHPEWQRRYIKHLLDMVNDAPRKVQIIVTTNSPFMISDILNDDITYLSDDKEGNEAEKRKNTRTLGQNIHTLLKDNFFMKSTIGEYSKELMENIISCLQTDDQNMKNIATEKIKAYFGDIEIDYNAIRLLIEQIGEPLYKIPLKEMLENSPFANPRKNDARISELEEIKRKIQEEIDALKERN